MSDPVTSDPRASVADLERAALARLLHRGCVTRWAEDPPDVLVTMHGPEAHAELAAGMLEHAAEEHIDIRWAEHDMKRNGWFGFHRCGGEERELSYSRADDDSVVHAVCAFCGSATEMRMFNVATARG